MAGCQALPWSLAVRYAGTPLRAFAAGKTYRVCRTDATHLEAFHQAEVLWMDERARSRGVAAPRPGPSGPPTPRPYGFFPGSHAGLNVEFASHSIGFTIDRIALVMWR